jgi:hypothetical protein
VKIIEAESIVVTRAGGRGRMWSYYLMGRVSVWDGKKVLETLSGEGCMTV